ncbi:MAG: hypothetical protein QOI59_6198, partial [Gammaproteobacteria bacterium]|nr:hypothetical protein [Gammaproteobacteria bacterium]
MLRLGFACVWDRPPEATWSHTPWMLRENLRALCDVEDVDLTFPELARQALRLAYARPSGGRLRSMWTHERPARFINERRLAKATRSLDFDALLQIGDIGVVSAPYYVIGDLSND